MLHLRPASAGAAGLMRPHAHPNGDGRSARGQGRAVLAEWGEGRAREAGDAERLGSWPKKQYPAELNLGI